MNCGLHSYSIEPKHRKPFNYGTCPDCTKAWDKYRQRQRWKRRERDSAKRFGERRNPGSGASTPENPGDSTRFSLVGEFFAVKEHRDRKTWDVPGWWREVEAEAKGGQPLLTLTKPGIRGELAVLRTPYLADLLKELSELRRDLKAGFSPDNGLEPRKMQRPEAKA